MAQIELLDGSIHVVCGERDILSLVEEHMGLEVRLLIEDLIAKPDPNEGIEKLEDGVKEDDQCIEEIEKRLDGVRSHFRDVMKALREQSEVISGLIEKRNIDRAALSTAAGKIGEITWRELNALSTT